MARRTHRRRLRPSKEMSEEDLRKYRQALRDFNDVNRQIRRQARQDWSVVHGACGTDGVCNTTIKHRKFLKWGDN